MSAVAFTPKSSDEYLECLSKKLYKECNKGINTCGKELKDGCPDELRPLSKESIFEYLKNHDTQSNCDDYCRQPVLACKTENDFDNIIRDGADDYKRSVWDGKKLTYQSIPCPATNYNFYLIAIGGFSLLSIAGISITLWQKYKKKGKSKTKHSTKKK